MITGEMKIIIPVHVKAKELTDRQRQNLDRRAVRRGAKIIIPPLQSRLPVESGALRDAIGIKISAKQYRPVVAVIGARTKFRVTYKGKERWPKFYSWQQNQGWVYKAGRYDIQETAAQYNDIALGVMRRYIATEIDRILK